jgi:hypothetical protein
MPKSPTPVLTQETFELRYHRGYRYLDRCGDVLVILEELLPKDAGGTWLTEELTPTRASLKCPEYDGVILIDASRMVVQVENPDGARAFNRIVTSVAQVVLSKFYIEAVARYGHRIDFMIPTDTLDEAERLSTLFSAAPGKAPESVEGFSFKAHEWATRFEDLESHAGFRLKVSPQQRIVVLGEVDERIRQPSHLLPRGQKEALIAQLRRKSELSRNPQVGLSIDIDCYSIDLGPKQRLSDFLTETLTRAERLRDMVLKQQFQ